MDLQNPEVNLHLLRNIVQPAWFCFLRINAVMFRAEHGIQKKIKKPLQEYNGVVD
jgi:hypothetical protein